MALDVDGVTTFLFEHAPRRHAELLLPMVDQLLSAAYVELKDLSAIGCCVGPGAFTGLRIAISVAQGLAYASGKSCIAISSLDTLAEQAFAVSNADFCLSSIDARMKEVYFSVLKRDDRCEEGFEARNGHLRILKEQVIPPQLIDLPHEINTSDRVFKAGTGWAEYTYTKQIAAITSSGFASSSEREGNVEYPDAKWMLPIAKRKLALGEVLIPERLQPIYLRNNVAVKKPPKPACS